MNNKLCRHCGIHKVNRPKGLCWRCSFDPAIRTLYHSDSKFARRYDDQDFVGTLPLPVPTAALPGTDEKIAVMERRAEDGEAIFHPLDATRRLERRA